MMCRTYLSDSIYPCRALENQLPETQIFRKTLICPAGCLPQIIQSQSKYLSFLFVFPILSVSHTFPLNFLTAVVTVLRK